MQAGEKILIHAGTGGVGQAAIQIARHLGLEIFATAGTPQKRELLLELGAHHALDSRTLAFADAIREITQGRGVDAVLNSLAGDFIPKSLSTLAPYGRFLEIGKVDIYKNSKIGLEALRNNNSYFVIDLVQHGQTRPDFVASLLREIQERFEAGVYQPLRYTVFPITEVVDAFRYMAQGKHVGKNVLTFDVPEIPIGLCAQPRHRFRPDATYLITGGASGIGMELAKWLSHHGARHIALCSRSGPRDESVREGIDRMRSAGVHVSDLRADVTLQSDVRRAITQIQQEGPPLKGVIHAAMVLDDEFIVALDEARFTAVMRPKILGAWNLHQATADAELEHFICLSSFSGVVGAIKQSNYSVANHFLDALAHYRRARGLPALTISWGGLLGAGFVERNRKTAEFMTSAGFKAFSLNEALDTFSRLTLTDAVHIGAARIDWRTFPKVCPNLARANTFAALTEADGRDEKGGSLLARLQQTSPAERPRVLADFIAAQVAGVFGLAADKIERDVPLTRLGLDSLMALELTIRLEREIGTKISMSNLLGGRTINGLGEPILRLLNQTAVPERQPDAKEGNETASASTALQSNEDSYFQVLSGDAAQEAIAGLRFEGAALLYLPDKLVTVGGFNDAELAVLFGNAPFISHFYESALGRIAIITLPVRSHGLSDPEQVRNSLVSAVELAIQHEVRCVSLTGLIPSLTHYGQDLAAWLRGTARCPTVTTGHATTSAAVIHNLQQMLNTAGRSLAQETLAVLGLGSIGQSCLRLLLALGPHPRELVLCDVFAKEQEWRNFANALREEHGYGGSIRTASSHAGAPAAVYEATTILTAVSVPDVLDISQLRPGTVIVDDSYPPAFPVEHAMRRMQTQGDIFFSNAGMLRLSQPIKETLLVPANLAGELKRFGVAAFREESIRDPFELTGCVLSSLLTARTEGDFTPTLGMAGLQDLLSHYHALTALDIRAARAQCDRYFIPDEAIEQFCRRFGQPVVTDANDGANRSAQPGSRRATPSMTIPAAGGDRC
jgi:NADPH:quinone reductase-like Zn-dependent oxidoreductase/acyl carrier protein